MILVEILDQEDDAQRILADDVFIEKWHDLGARCPWATAFQDAPFVSAWFKSYGRGFSPVIVRHQDQNGCLRGLLILAKNKVNDGLVVAGSHQAEYKCWLTDGSDKGAFLTAALGALLNRFPGRYLKFDFLPPGTPTSSVFETPFWARRAIVRDVPRPLMELGNGKAIDRSLKKKSNKSRYNRLRRQGDLRLRILESPADLKPLLPQIAVQYDLRQGGRNATMPFHEDPHKADFLIELMQTPGLLNAGVLMLDDQVIAANLGVRTDNVISVGVFSFSPVYTAESPGKLLLLLLGSCLAKQGIQTIDLTPGGQWKERFANSHDEVSELIVYFDGRMAARIRARRFVDSSVKRGLTMIGLPPRRIRAMAGSFGKAASRLIERHGSDGHERLECYVIDAAVAQDWPVGGPLKCNLLDQLVSLAPMKNPYPFVDRRLTRLESGERFYADAQQSPPRMAFWMTGPGSKTMPFRDSPRMAPPATGSVFIYRDEAIEASGDGAFTEEAIRQLAQAASTLVSVKDVLVLVSPKDDSLRAAVTRLGFRPCGSSL